MTDVSQEARPSGALLAAPGEKYYLRTFGCQMNEHDSERMAGMLEAAGYTRSDTPDDAAVVLFNTCCIRENADMKLYGNLGHMKTLKESRPDLKIVVGGCLAQKDRAGIQERAPYVDVVLGTHNLASLPRLLVESASAPSFEILEQTEVFPSALPARRSSAWHAWVSISIGCNNSCTFCIVPAVRGAEVSRRVGDIVHEVEGLVRDGVVEVTLLGQNVNSYGRDLDGTPLFSKLLFALDEIPGLERVRFTSPHPKDFRSDSAQAMAVCDSVCEHIHLPLQSGSKRVLKMMKRAYTRESFLEKVAMIRAAIPEVAITTDIIVGFPGETEADFAETLQVVEEVRFDAAYTFQYSSRPGTEAAGLPGHLPKEVVQERFERLADLQDGIQREIYESMVDKTFPLLVEGPSRKDPSRLTGRTRTNKIVHFADDGAEAGTFRTVRITRASTRHLEGEVVGIPDREVSVAEPPDPKVMSLPMVGNASGGCCG